MSRKVSYVRLQTALDFPGVVGAIGNTLPSQQKTLEDLEMVVNDNVLEVKFKYKKLDHNLLIPMTNVIFARALPEEKKGK